MHMAIVSIFRPTSVNTCCLIPNPPLFPKSPKELIQSILPMFYGQFGFYNIRSPNFLTAGPERGSPNPGVPYSIRHPFLIAGGFSNSSAWRGSRSGSWEVSTIHPAGLAATMCARMKQSWCRTQLLLSLQRLMKNWDNRDMFLSHHRLNGINGFASPYIPYQILNILHK